MVNTHESWQRVPSAPSALVGASLPYHPPRSPLAAFLWRKRMLFETTTGLTLLEPWEKVFMLTIMVVLVTLVLTGLVTFVPHSLILLEKRTAYYLFGHEPTRSASASVQRFLAGWVSSNATGEL